MGAVGRGHAPTRDDFSPNALFPIVWMFVGYIFAINLFIGVVVDQFSKQQQIEQCSAVMTPEQQQWAQTVAAMASSLPRKIVRAPHHPLRRLAHQLVNARPFDGFIHA